MLAVVATALSGLLVTSGLVYLAVSDAPAAKAATYTPYSGSTTIDTTSQSAVQAAFTNWYSPTTTVPINWTQPSDCLAGSGSNDAATSESGLDAVNFYRAMAGLAPVTDYPAGDSYDAAAVTMMEGSGGGIAYTTANPDPHHPASTDQCYTSNAATGTASSNLAFGSAGFATSAATWVGQWVDDSGANNLTELGHRRWLLNPPTTSMGMAYGPTSAALGVTSPAATGASDSTTTDVAWPSAGYFPYELLPSDSNQWSYSIPGADFSKATVSVTKNGTAYPVTVQALLSGYGQSTISWILGSAPTRPAFGSSDDYNVTISGISDANGAALPNVSYDVKLFSASLGGGGVSIASGAVTVGTPVTATATGFPLGTNLTYQWNDVTATGTTPIAGATGSTYTPAASDAGQFLSVTVTASLTGYPTASITSSPTTQDVQLQKITAQVSAPKTGSVGVAIAPQITGTPDGATISYSWADAAGTVVGTDSSYTPVLSQANTTITLTITITASGYTPANYVPFSIAIEPAVLSGTVSITGTPAVGSTLTATPAGFPSGTTYTYQWYTGPITGNVIPITGATGSTYTPVVADLNKYLDVQITATATGFTNSPFQNATQTQTTVAEGTFSGSVAVTGGSGTASGTAQVGDTLTATPSGYPSATAYTYQWYEGATAINNANTSTYTVTTGDAGQSLSVQLGASLSGYTSATVTSATVPVAMMTMSVSVSISGVADFGNVLTATTSGLPTGASLSYQWSSNGSPISGATASTYTPAAADVGNSLTVTVNVSATGYNPDTATSSAATVAEQAVPGSVSISGTTTVGDTVTALTTGFPSTATLSYQWYLGTAPITAATGSTYTIAPADFGQSLSVEVTASAAEYITATVSSAAVTVGALSMSGTVSIAGTPAVGNQLTATPSGFPSGATFTFQWYRGGTAISGATASTYTPTAVDAGQNLTVQLTATATGYTTGTATSSQVSVPLQTMSGSVSVTGTAVVGNTLTAVPAGFPTGTSFTYQWYRGATAISGATSSSYALANADAGQNLTVQLTATATGYTTGTATSSQVSVPLLVMVGTVSISGTATVGSTLTANPSGFPTGATFTYQWYRASTAIASATSSTYALTSADSGASVTVHVTASASGYSPQTVISNAIAVTDQTMSGSVSISGTAAVGSTLTANPSDFPVGATFTYQWSVGSTAIGGATDATYTPVTGDGGQSITVQIVATAAGYLPETVSSSAVTVADQASSASVVVSGTPEVGATLTATPSGFSSNSTLTYQWYRGETAIAGATDSSYTLVAADAGHSLNVQVTATTGGNTTVTASSQPVTVTAQAMSGAVSIVGSAAIGSQLTATPSGFPAGATYTYQWFSGGTAISGATASTYTPVTADAGASITVQITASASGYDSQTVTSQAVTVSGPTQNTQNMVGTVTISGASSGTATVGTTLTANPSGFPVGASFTYQWYRGSTGLIVGATASTYTLQAADSGQLVVVKVTATATGYNTSTASSAPISVAVQILTMPGTVTISGSLSGYAAVGNALTAAASGFPAGATYSYQWYRNGGVISGATGSSYKPVSSDSGSSLSVQITATANGYATASVTSAAVKVAAQAAVTRVGGVDRYATANAAAQLMYPNGASTVFLMNGLNFPDALSAAPAAAKLGAPILLTQPNVLTGSTLAELNKLKPKTVYVLGQTPSVSAATFAQVQNQVGSHPKVIRIGGSDRFVTSQMLASTVWGSSVKTVFVASGMNYTDGEAAAAAAAKVGAPLLLVNGGLSSGTLISPAVAKQLKTWKPTTIHVVGNTANLTPAVFNALASTGASTDRTSGATPAATAIAVAESFFGTSSQVFIATDDAGAFSDALVAGALAGKVKAPVLFSDDSLSAGVAGEVLALNATKVTVMGNNFRLSTASIQALQKAIGATTNIS